MVRGLVRQEALRHAPKILRRPPHFTFYARAIVRHVSEIKPRVRQLTLDAREEPEHASFGRQHSQDTKVFHAELFSEPVDVLFVSPHGSCRQITGALVQSGPSVLRNVYGPGLPCFLETAHSKGF